MNQKNFVGNAFSLQMIEAPSTITVEEVNPQEIPDDAESCIGHLDTATVVSGILGRAVPCQRTNIRLAAGDILYVAQLVGGRLPEGSTTLPEGFSIKFLKVSVT